jgi:hypothetical protein
MICLLTSNSGKRPLAPSLAVPQHRQVLVASAMQALLALLPQVNVSPVQTGDLPFSELVSIVCKKIFAWYLRPTCSQERS